MFSSRGSAASDSDVVLLRVDELPDQHADQGRHHGDDEEAKANHRERVIDHPHAHEHHENADHDHGHAPSEPFSDLDTPGVSTVHVSTSRGIGPLVFAKRV